MKNITVTVALLLSLTYVSSLHAQEQEQSTLDKIRQQQSAAGGSLTGIVTDERSGEDLIGANVFIVDTKLGASTDIEGKFLIKRVPEGTYTVRFSFLGYESKTISDVVIKTGEPTVLSISLGEDQGIQQQEVVISASTIKSGEGAILAERKKAVSIGDGISSEQMKKAPDATSGDALKRVTGVTLVDNKFVFVRGVTDRYNQTTLNGASVTSTSVDKKSFSFDMLPSNLIENMNVAKTATPDLPGDFTGGLVQLNTLDFPEARSVKFVYSGGFNSITTFEPFNRSQGGNTDWLGSDDGIRTLPDGVVAPADAMLVGTKGKNTFAPRNVNAPMNQSMSISLADVYNFEEDQFGYLAALSYRNSFQRTNGKLNDYTSDVLNRDLQGTSDRYSVLWGGILDLSLKFADLHKVSLKNNYNRSAEDKYNVVSGTDRSNDQYVRSYQNEWEERGMLSNQLGGEHKFPELLNMNADWLVYFSEAKTSQPDRKQVDYNLSTGYPDTDPFSVNTQLTARSWGRLYDRSLGQKMNFSIPVDEIKVKFGMLHEQKNRHYEVRYFQPTFPMQSELLNYGIDSVFAPENFGAGKYGYQEITKPSDKYSGAQGLLAVYSMVDVPFALFDQNFRFTGGVRMENSKQEVITTVARTTYEPSVNTIDKSDFLPSVNLTYVINEVQNLRVAYSHTVNRPEFRELANVYFYDFDKFEYVVGSSTLTRAYARNYDIRYEIFPDAGDLFAVSYFHKNISSPIEEMREFTSGASQRTWINASHATNTGYELEIRKHLGFIGEYFRFMQIVANYTRIYSEVPYRELSGQSGVVEGVRQMQGQSPYMYNVSFFFTEPTLGTSMNILYNEYGSRIDAIGQIGNGDFNVIEHKRGTVDLSLTQPMSMLVNGLEAKYSVKNLNNQPTIFTHGANEYRRNITGITHSLQFSFNF
jgi:hypothetical protein